MWTLSRGGEYFSHLIKGDIYPVTTNERQFLILLGRDQRQLSEYES